MSAWPAPTEADVRRVVDAVVASCHPVRIVLFGSTSRGAGKQFSDLDLMVVMPDGTDRLQLAGELHQLMYRQKIKVPVDFIVTTPAHLSQHAGNAGTVYPTILREGREVYAAA